MSNKAKNLGKVSVANAAAGDAFLIDESFNGAVTIRGNGRPCNPKKDSVTGKVMPGQQTVSFESGKGRTFRIPMSIILQAIRKSTEKIDALFTSGDNIKYIPATKLHLKSVAGKYGITVSNSPITA